MKRREGESFEDYKKRRDAENKAIKRHLAGRKIKHTYKELVKIMEGQNG